MQKLLIVESPAKAKTISKYLSDLPDKYKVVASIGHIRDLPKSNKKAIDIENDFLPHYEISKGKEKVVEEIKKLTEKSDEVLLATDPDREGEAIAWHIFELIKNEIDKSKIKRVTYHEITKEAIKDALEHPRLIDQDLRHAQEARRVLDRLVGYDLSGLIWKKVRYGLSAGRVQSPALRIIMEREREIRAFKSHPFWVISAEVLPSPRPGLGLENFLPLGETSGNFFPEVIPKGDTFGKVHFPKVSPLGKFTAVCDEEPTDKKIADNILEKGRNSKWQVLDIKETEVKKLPRSPFITSTLQQTASSRLGFSPAKTMGIAQKLYEAGLITYMRTDSTTISKQALGQIAGVVEKKYGKQYLHFRTFANKSKNAQEAHEAIRPTNISLEKGGHSDEQKKLYELIWRRTVSSQMMEAKVMRTKVIVQAIGADIPNFSSNGSRIIYDGWLLADPQSRSEDVELPKVSIKENLDLQKLDYEEKQTEPPTRYSEAGLIKELEKRGIGRPSTYASIIKTIEDRGYVEKINKALMPTDTGDVVSTFLENNFYEYINDDFTADMENKLDKIAEGKEEYSLMLGKFYKPFLADVKKKDKLDKITNLGDADPKFKCPVCGSGMIIKLGKSGKFISCSRYPDCDGSLTIDGHEIKKDDPIGFYPESGQPIFVMNGKYGPYVQLGPSVEKTITAKGVTKKKQKKLKPRMASIPKGKDPSTVTVEDAVKYFSLPKVLGVHPDTGENITASIGRFGPYIVHQKDFRSLKEDDVYTIELPRALEILAQEKKKRGFARKKTK